MELDGYLALQDWQLSSDESEWVKPLNGFHIFERVYHEKINKFDIHSEQRVNTRLGVVKYVAKNNAEYETGMETDHVELQVGDRVQFGPIPPVMLEDEAHCSFDGGRMYRRAQARNIDVVWRGGDIILPQGRVLIKRILDETITPAGIILPKAQVKNHTGEIIVSSVHECKVGGTLRYTKGGGMLIDHQGEQHRVIKDQEILYVD